MSIKRPFRYAGSKWKTNETVLKYIPSHICSIEPFVGSAAFTLSKTPSPVEIINDRNALLINFWKVVKYQGEELARRISLTPWSRTLFSEWVALLRDEEKVSMMLQEDTYAEKGNIDLAEVYCLKQWQSIATGFDCYGWLISTTRKEILPSEVGKRLLQATKRLEKVIIKEMDGIDLIKHYAGDPDSLIVIDPPYLADVSKRSAKRHYGDHFTREDHLVLLELITTPETKAKIMISSYPNPLYEEYLYGWSAFTVTTNRMIAVSNKNEGNGVSIREEKFWYNYEVKNDLYLSQFAY